MLTEYARKNIELLYNLIDKDRLPMFAQKLSVSALKCLFGIKLINHKYGFLNRDVLIRLGLLPVTDTKYLIDVNNAESSEEVFRIISKSNSKAFLSAYAFYRASVLDKLVPYYLNEHNQSSKKYEDNEKILNDILCASYKDSYFAKMDLENMRKVIQSSILEV